MVTESDPILSLLTAFLVISTIAVAFATLRVWKATQNVADATNMIRQTMKEIGSYTIMPHLSIYIHGIKQKETTYDQFEFRVNNDGIGDAFNIRMEISSDETSTSIPQPFNLPRNQQTHVYHSVKKESKIINFKIKFDDMAGNTHERLIDLVLTDPRENYGKQYPHKPVPSDVDF